MTAIASQERRSQGRPPQRLAIAGFRRRLQRLGLMDGGAVCGCTSSPATFSDTVAILVDARDLKSLETASTRVRGFTPPLSNRDGYLAKKAYNDGEQDGLKAPIYGFARGFAGKISCKPRLIAAAGVNEANDN